MCVLVLFPTSYLSLAKPLSPHFQYCANTANVTLASEDLVGMREKVYHLLKDTPFRVVIFHEVSIVHAPYHLSASLTVPQHFQSSHLIGLVTCRSCDISITRVIRAWLGDINSQWHCFQVLIKAVGYIIVPHIWSCILYQPKLWNSPFPATPLRCAMAPNSPEQACVS